MESRIVRISSTLTAEVGLVRTDEPGADDAELQAFVIRGQRERRASTSGRANPWENARWPSSTS